MFSSLLKKSIPHLIAIALFALIALVYCAPVLSGKKVDQHDMNVTRGSSKETVDFREKTGIDPLWSNSMFSGMPAYLISNVIHENIFAYIFRISTLGLPDPAQLIFLYLIGFYILLCVLKFDQRLAIVGAIAYAFSSYFFIIIQAGHVTKAMALAFAPVMVAGVLSSYKKNYVTGFILTVMGMGLEIYSNHLQITYYTALALLIMVIMYLVDAIRKKQIIIFFKSTGMVSAAVLLAVLPNITSLYSVYDYGKYSTRGPSELTEKKVSTGLDKDYATDWSYGIAETMTLLIPDFMGGASQTQLDRNSATYKALVQNAGEGQAQQFIKSVPLYWGDQPITNGPTYVGAIIFFLFVLGLMLIKEIDKWWLLTATVLSILLAWGRNFQWFTDIFFDYFPGYNKFRAVSMTLIIAEFTMPFLGLLGLKKILDGSIPLNQGKQALLRSTYITGGICLLFLILPGLLGLSGKVDSNFTQYPWLLDAIKEDRANALRVDAFRSLFFIVAAALLIYFTIQNKIQKKILYLSLGGLLLLDMWTVNKRYFNNTHFVAKGKVEVPFTASAADEQILKDPDPDYRVMNTTVSTFNDASTSYFHKSIGGYHGAKMKRYQELIEYQISKNNMQVLNMLNTKYFIVQPQGAQQPVAQMNPGALGHAWFVSDIKWVPNADSEMSALSNFDPKNVAIIDERFKNQLNGFKIQPDSNASITLTHFQPNEADYKTQTNSEQLAVFSEIYYANGWQAYVDGKKADHFRVNYVLRALRVPAGTHEIKFKFEPQDYYLTQKIALAGSSLIVILIVGFSIIGLKKQSQSEPPVSQNVKKKVGS